MLSSTRSRIIAAAAALLLICAGTWWAIDASQSSDEAIEIPEKVCDERVSGKSVTNLFPKKGDKFKEETYQFDARRNYGDCKLQAGGEKAGFSYIYRSGGKYPRKSIQSQGVRVSLGEAYGYMSKHNGAILLYIPCGTNAEKDTGSRLLITAGASMVEQAKESQQLNESMKEIGPLAAFTAQAARDMSRGWFKCPGSESLPDGPVVIHWND
ncbi:hypothetical protein [Streptomyces yatensis]|uniref:Uncharacterized protein n=1 Tax=Streptomyces yatensis TaxID=155177 RepID=A0ABN2GZD3_9ACTN|nr:hypothetical protein [Streptomyces yatensis]